MECFAADAVLLRGRGHGGPLFLNRSDCTHSVLDVFPLSTKCRAEFAIIHPEV
jgi:hypothetical protein